MEFTSITETATTSRRMLSRSFPKLGIGKDAPHAFYLGAELMKAEIAWRLGKRYAQDEPLDWGCGGRSLGRRPHRLREAGHTLRASSSAS
jgi:Dihydropteroate synthase and related enzymes